jgi:hypothetical protein
MRSPEHGRRREAGFAVADEAGRRQRRRIPGSPAVPPSSSLSLPLSDGADSRWAPRVSPFFSSRATTPFYAPFPPARPFSAPSPPARPFSSRAHRLFTGAASIRRLGERGDAIRTEAMASPTPQLENRPDA